MTNPICPQCATLFVKPVHRESFLERILNLIYVHPFCCQLCGFRFQYLHWGFKCSNYDKDRRAYERLPVSLTGTCTSDGIVSQGFIVDISMLGCAMRTTTKLHLGAILSVLIRTPEEMAPIAIEAGVVRHEERNLVGIEFLKVGKIDKERLLQYIHKIHQQKENPLTDLDLQRDLPDQGNTPLKAEEYRVQPNRLPKRAAGELNP